MRFVLLAACISTSISGCATIVRGTTENVTFASSPTGATARASTGMVCEVTPCTFELPRDSQFSVVFSKSGYQPQQVLVGTHVPVAGGAALAGNILAGGIIGAAVDASNGAALEHTPNPVFATLTPEEPVPTPIVERKKRRRQAVAASE